MVINWELGDGGKWGDVVPRVWTFSHETESSRNLRHSVVTTGDNTVYLKVARGVDLYCSHDNRSS